MPIEVTVQAAAAGSYDQYGQPVLDAGLKTYRARKQLSKRRVRDSAGNTVTSTQQLYLATTDPISVEDKFTVPGWDLKGKQVIEVRRVDDDEGPHHTVVYF